MGVVNEKFWAEFSKDIHKELKGSLAGQPSIRIGGVRMDHYKGLASSMKTRLVPFAKESYQASEFLYGYVPVQNKILPHIFVQCAVLEVKGKNVPGVGNFGAVLKAEIPETYVAPYADWKHRLIPLSALPDPDANAGKIFKNRSGWSPFLEAANADKAVVKALGKPNPDARVGDYKVKMDSQRLSGFIQLAPYKGRTLMTLQSAPGFAADVNRPRYDWKDFHDAFLKIAMHAMAHPQAGEEIGQLFLNESNAVMMDLMTKQVDKAVSGTAPAPS